MGVFHFYSWFRKQYSKDIYRVNKSICENNHSIDNLLIDMNGSSDYLEIYVYMSGGSTRRMYGGQTISRFSGVWIRS